LKLVPNAVLVLVSWFFWPIIFGILMLTALTVAVLPLSMTSVFIDIGEAVNSRFYIPIF
jgi:hypothetical protein